MRRSLRRGGRDEHTRDEHAEARLDGTHGLSHRPRLHGHVRLYGPADEDESIATIHAALEAGISLLDTGDYYGEGHNELLLGKALRGGDRESMFLSVKFGVLRAPGGEILGVDGRPEAVKNSLGYTLRRLDTDYVDIYRLGRIDPDVPIEETVGAISELIDGGYVRHVGLSEAGAETIRRAHAVRPVSDLQIEYSLVSRGIEDDILPTCRDLGVGVTAYGVLSRGLISGHWSRTRELGPGDFRSGMPRFSEGNVERNLQLVEALREIAEERGCSVAQLAISWVLAQGMDIVPLVGARRRDRLGEAFGALDVDLDDEALSAIERAIPKGAAAGERYDARQMAILDSERS